MKKMGPSWKLVAALVGAMSCGALGAQTAHVKKPTKAATTKAKKKSATSPHHAVEHTKAGKHPAAMSDGAATTKNRHTAVHLPEATAESRRLSSAFIASAQLRPMAQQLVLTRSAAAYAGVNAYAAGHPGDAAAAADLAVGHAYMLDWTFADAFEAREAIRVLDDAGLWQRVVDRTEPADSLRGRTQLALTLIVQDKDLDAAVRLLREKIGLFPKPEVGDGLGSPLSGMQGMVLLAMFDRHEGLVAAEALGKAGISYCWRDGADESQELPDEQTVAIEVRGELMDVATGVVEKALAASDGEALRG